MRSCDTLAFERRQGQVARSPFGQDEGADLPADVLHRIMVRDSSRQQMPKFLVRRVTVNEPVQDPQQEGNRIGRIVQRVCPEDVAELPHTDLNAHGSILLPEEQHKRSTVSPTSYTDAAKKVQVNRSGRGMRK